MKKIMSSLGAIARDASTACKSACLKVAVAVSSAMAALPVVGASASDIETFSTKGQNGGTTTAVIGTVANLFSYAGLILGLILVIVGIFQFASAFRNEDAEGKTKASHTIIGGVILMAVGGIIQILIGTVL